MEINYQISQRIKVIPIAAVFSNWDNFSKKVSIINCSTNSKSFKTIYFFFEIQKLKIFEKTSRFFVFSFLAFITLFELSVDYVFRSILAINISETRKKILKNSFSLFRYVDCDQMAKDAIKAVEDGAIKLYPAASTKQWNSWLERIRPWCISRQLWWGHQIPAYYVSFVDPAKMPQSLDKHVSPHN